jgi:hypothetical protein
MLLMVGESFWEREILISRGFLKVSRGLKVIEVKNALSGVDRGEFVEAFDCLLVRVATQNQT